MTNSNANYRKKSSKKFKKNSKQKFNQTSNKIQLQNPKFNLKSKIQTQIIEKNQAKNSKNSKQEIQNFNQNST